MDKAFIARQKRILEKEKKRLDKEITRLDKFQNIGQSEEDSVQEVEETSGKEATEDALRAEAEQVEKALAAISRSTYGTCAKCHGEIDQGRLAVYPAATTCAKCSK